jgi:hypothetical protein
MKSLLRLLRGEREKVQSHAECFKSYFANNGTPPDVRQVRVGTKATVGMVRG